MKISSKDVKKINLFSSLPDKLCEKISNVISVKTCLADTKLYKEGDTGNTMLLIFQGQVEISKNMAVKSMDGFAPVAIKRASHPFRALSKESLFPRETKTLSHFSSVLGITDPFRTRSRTL